MSTPESHTTADLIARARRDADLLDARHAPTSSLAASLREYADAMERMTGERDAMVARWPDDRNGAGPVLYCHSDGTWWLETLHGNRWPRVDRWAEIYGGDT